MKLVFTFFLLAASQLKFSLAEEPTGIDYENIIRTAEKRFKVVMRMMKDGKFKEHLVTFAKEEFKKHCEKGPMGVPPPGPQPNVEVAEGRAPTAEAFAELLEKVGTGLHEVFTGLYGANYMTLAFPAEEKRLTEGSEASNETELTNEVHFLNMRFALPQLYSDVFCLYNIVNPEGKNTTLTVNAPALQAIKEWARNNTPNIKLLDNINQETFEKGLKALFGDSNPPFHKLKVHIEVFNGDLSQETKDAIEKCRKLNSALFGSVAILFASMLTFTAF
ncbi:uncharacterized protein BXIN_2756 [Babesia sp. Xinjiang]|uniref:uncharacterized protein n=1 Tax=Babesia sp. Xinjiang TaxID=462227 RepID=UPI000A22E520|nr:uncharacterized protein BXIN_2756 [Babesia sp. Xinjiang]ORM41680.1 hypothetical protein BXIN_2756 [Babesia sp. Xinjiang]